MDTKKLDRQIEFLGKEITALRGKSERWAQAKVEMLQEIQSTLLEIRGQQPINQLGM